jgi:transcriptional regulator of NAD metabolism
LNAEERRRFIQSLLSRSPRPYTGSELAAKLGVSRQVIVQDIAILRARGGAVIATPQGYVARRTALSPGETRIIACSHHVDRVREELVTIVEAGAEVVDVIVDHPLYGEITGRLMLRSVEDVDRFMARLHATKAVLLSSLTRGVHIHTIRSPDPSVFPVIEDALRSKGILLD